MNLQRSVFIDGIDGMLLLTFNDNGTGPFNVF